MASNINDDEDVVSVKQLILASLAIVVILGLWFLLSTTHVK